MKNNYLKFKILILFVVSAFQVFSQGMVNKEFVLKQVTENSKLIFEGTILSKGNSFRASNNAIYTSYEAQIDKVVYGTKTTSKINIIIAGGQIEEDGLLVGTSTPHGLSITLSTASVIFCQPFTIGNLPNSYLLTEQVTFNAKNEVMITNSLSEYYKNINDLYKDLSKELNIQITEKKSLDVNENTNITLVDLISSSEKQNNYNNHIAFFTSKHNNPLNQKTSKVLANDLTLSTGNEIITTVGLNRFLEFDVFAKANTSGLYFDNCLLRLQYNTASFGSNMMAAGNATITKGASFNSATYINPNTNFIDQNSNTLGIPFGIDYTQTTLNRTVLTTTDKILLHIRLKIQNCGQTSDLEFVDASSISFLNFYTTTANAPATAGNSFDNSTYISPATNVLCTVIVDDFNSPIQGGVGSTFTINGNNFGATRGNGKVRFRNANAATFPFLKGLDNEDYLSWTNTQIKIKLPSSTTLGGDYNNPGSGAFIVKNDFGDSTVAFFNGLFQGLVIDYSIDTKLAGTKKFKMNLKNQNTLGGYTIRLDTSISNYPDRKGCVIKAIKDWRCFAGANLVLGSDISIPIPTNDGITTIAFTSTLVAGQVAGTFVQGQICTTGSSTVVGIPDFDTQISRQYNFFYDTTGLDVPNGMYDFYEAMVHEIGHGLGLLHVIDTNLIMYRTTKVATNGISLAGSLRRKLFISSGDTDGGLFQAMSSASAMQGQCTGFVSHQLVNTSCDKVGIFENMKNAYDFSIYPNPTNGDIVNVVFNNSKPSKAKINVCDIMGRVLYSNNISEQDVDTNEYVIDLNGFSDGMYFINLTIDGYSISQKVIKN